MRPLARRHQPNQGKNAHREPGCDPTPSQRRPQRREGEDDANCDDEVDPLDAGFVQTRFGCPVNTGDPECDAADVSNDGFVDPLDVGFVLARFGDCL